MDKDIDACLVKKEMFKVDGNSFYQIKEEGDENLAGYRGLGVINGMTCYLFATRKKDLAISDGKAWGSGKIYSFCARSITELARAKEYCKYGPESPSVEIELSKS